MSKEEVGLAQALLAGEPEAFEQFVDHFRLKLFRYVWLMCGKREDAEEVTQETLLKVFEKLSQLDTPEHIRPWVFRIARNECLMMRRKSIFAPTRELSLDEFLPVVYENGEHRHLQIADWAALPDGKLLQSELREQIERGIQELPESYRSVILMRDVEQLSTEETARVLDVTTDLVKTRLHRGRLALRQKLDNNLQAGQTTHRAEER